MKTSDFITHYNNNSKIFKNICTKCSDLLRSDIGKETYDYIKPRLKQKDIINYNFGYLPQDSKLFDLFDINDLKYTKIVFEKPIKDQFNTINYDLHFKNHPLIFPIKDEYNNIVGIIGRTIFTEDKRKQLNIDKYKYTFFTKTHILFGLNEAKQAISQYKSVILVEGQIDCIQLQSKGFYNVVALGGLDLHPYQFYLLKKYGGSDLRINILLDEDAAGQNAIAKISKKYNDKAKINKVMLPKSYKDIDEYITGGNDLFFLANT